MAACYSAAPGRHCAVPFDIATGELDDEVWAEWLEWDPVRMARKRRDAVRRAARRLDRLRHAATSSTSTSAPGIPPRGRRRGRGGGPLRALRGQARRHRLALPACRSAGSPSGSSPDAHGRSGSTTSRSRSATSTRRSSGTRASSTSRSRSGSPGWRSSAWATSSSRSPRAAASRRTTTATSASSSTTRRPCAPRWRRRATSTCRAGRTFRFVDPWGNQFEVVGYQDVQFTKTPSVLRALRAERLEKTEAAKAEIREHGLDG